MVLSLTLLLQAMMVGAMEFVVGAREEQCFMIKGEVGDKVVVEYQVVSGGFMDIDLKLFGPDMKAIYKQDRQKEGLLHTIAQVNGLYKLCFGNQMSTITSKTITFEYHLASSKAHHDAITHEHINPLQQAVMAMKENIRSLKTQQSFLRNRINRHTDTIDSTSNRIFWFQFLETAVLIAVACVQLILLKNFFEKK